MVEWNGNGSSTKPHELQFASWSGILIEYLCAKTWHILANQFELSHAIHPPPSMSNYFQRYPISINSGAGKYISPKAPDNLFDLYTQPYHISSALQFG